MIDTDSTGRTLVIALTDEEAARYEDWTECAAFRIRQHDDGTAHLELTNDLDLITRPDAPDA